ncbi:MAG TPA: competence/damage-inducible protein A [Vicinamibacterales bacterium]|nr:competence/damage-inducible protein A [Vicinamibacterales bacterium]
MKAWILAVGSEMLTPFRVDTNSLTITEHLNAIGCDVRMKAVVGDDVAELSALFTRGIGTVDLIVCTGGLGPTEDDITRDAAARALDLSCDLDERILQSIRARFEARGMVMQEINRRQAMVPRGAVVLDNSRGTAPGLWLERDGTGILLLPGPPREMQPMLERIIAERLKPIAGTRGLFRRVLRITGRPESEVDAIAQPVYGKWLTRPVPIATTILAKMGQIELHLTADAPGEAAAAAALDAAVAELHAALGASVYSVDGRGLEEVIGDLLRERDLTMAVAESCTGGLLASRITDVPGSSSYFDRGVVCYSNRAKVEWVGVAEDLIAQWGAVSEPVARAMAEGIRARAGAGVGIGITGVAGPGGGTAAKPVGTVAIAVVTPGAASVRTFAFIGPREMVKFQSTQAAMNMLRLLLTAS